MCCTVTVLCVLYCYSYCVCCTVTVTVCAVLLQYCVCCIVTVTLCAVLLLYYDFGRAGEIENTVRETTYIGVESGGKWRGGVRAWYSLCSMHRRELMKEHMKELG